MVKIFGPTIPRYRFVFDESIGKLLSVEMESFEIQPTNLGNALEQYATRFSLIIQPYDGLNDQVPLPENEESKYFYYQDKKTAHGKIVDIHIQRNGTEICPKQNLKFQLEAGDVIIIGLMAC